MAYDSRTDRRTFSDYGITLFGKPSVYKVDFYYYKGHAGATVVVQKFSQIEELLCEVLETHKVEINRVERSLSAADTHWKRFAFVSGERETSDEDY